MSFMYALPQRPNNRGASSDPPPPSLPPRPGQTRKPPSHVAPPPPESESDDEDGPPPLPPHPRGSASLEDDDEPALIYDDCSEQEDNEPGEIYDDFDEGTTREEPPQLPHRPKPPPASPEFYDDITNASGPIVQHIPKKPGRNLPPLPSAVPDKYPPPPGSQENVYEVNEEGQSSSPLPPPIPPPKDSGPKTSKPAPQPRPSPTSKGIPTAGPQGINLAEMLKKREGLKVVSEPPAEQPTVRHDPKEYSDTSSSFKDVFQKFKEKQSKPGLTPKPAIMPKTMVPAISSNGSSAAPKPASLSMQPKDKTDSPQAPDVMFIHKPNKDIKDKSSNPPLPPVPSPSPVSKPVTKFEPEPSSFSAPEDIYDDAASADLLDRYDWYHGDLTRIEGEKRVKAVNKDGAFLVRVSQKDQKYPYTLVVMNGGHVNNLRIRRRQDEKFALGDEKADEMSFIDVVAMINHHKNHNVVLLGSSQAHVKLQHAAAKKIT